MAPSKKTPSENNYGMSALSGPMLAISPIPTKAWLDVVSEGKKFVARRFEQDMETQVALMACKDPAEVIKIQSEFYQTAMASYIEEAARIYEMMTKAAQDTIKDLQSGHKRKFDDVPL